MQERDGRAFLVRSVNNQFMGISQLSANYTDTTGLVSVAPKVSTFTSIHCEANVYKPKHVVEFAAGAMPLKTSNCR